MSAFAPLAQYPIGYSPQITAGVGNAQYITAGGVGFNGYDLNDITSIICQSIDVDDLTKVDLTSFEFPQSDGGGVLSKYYRGRQIKLKLFLKQSTPALLDTLIDTLKAQLKPTEGIFSFAVAGGETRIIPATVVNIKFDRNHYNLTFIKCEVTLQCAEAFFTTTTDQSTTWEQRSGNFSEEITHGGNATSLSRVYMIFGSASVSALSFSSNGKTIAPATSIITGDILIIDNGRKTVTKNGVSVDYAGTFFGFEP